MLGSARLVKHLKRTSGSSKATLSKRANATQAQRTLEGKTAIVTGSTSGIGLAVAKKLAGQGANVTLNGFGNKSEIQDLVSKISQEFKVKATYHGADISKPSEIRDLIAHTTKEFGAVDILVNNAGIQHVAPVDAFPEDRWDAIMAINLSAVFHGIKAVLPGMKSRGWGRIVNVSSVHGLVASANKSAYVAAKHGVVGLTKAVALETAGSGVTINTVCPGWVLTPLVQAQIEAKATKEGISIEEAHISLVGEKMPSKQFVESDFIGDTVLFFCSPAAKQLTGTSLPVDGGWTSQ
jgi:3-hydroxybutyrate dehydrogenase